METATYAGEKKHTLAASSRFGAFKPEAEHVVRIAKTETNHAVEEMKRAWAECRIADCLDNAYVLMLGRIRALEYSAKDVESFSIALSQFQGEKDFSYYKAGLFLSALINNCKEGEFVIHTAHLDEPIDALGFRNTKKITVEGGVRDDLGESMESGTIIVKGNAGSYIANRMRGGVLRIDGDYDEVSVHFHGGKLFWGEVLIFDMRLKD